MKTLACHARDEGFESPWDRMINGKQAEDLFFNLLKQEGLPSRSTKSEDMFDHWDVECNGIKYDVKTEKKLNRWDNASDSSIIWIELQNVRGDDGWLKGKADKLAFLVSNSFWIVDRIRLFDYIKSTITNLEIQNFKEEARWYRRKGRKDVVTYLKSESIKHLVEKQMLP